MGDRSLTASANGISGGAGRRRRSAAKRTTSCGGAGSSSLTLKRPLARRAECTVDDLRDVGDVNAIEDLTRLDDAFGRSVGKLHKGIAPRAVDACETQHRDDFPVFHQGSASGFCRKPRATRVVVVLGAVVSFTQAPS